MSPNLPFGGKGTESHYAILLTILGTVPLLLMVILCACWKRTRQKDEWTDVPGTVIHKNPEENINDSTYIRHFEQPILNGSITVDVVIDDANSNKRPSSMIKHRRSLPDIPNTPDQTLLCDPNGDNSSDLYATVHPPYNTGGSSLTDPQSSISQPDDPYARVDSSKKKIENPYAVVNENSNKLMLSELSNGGDNTGNISLAEIALLPSTSNPTSTCQIVHSPPSLPLPSPTNSTSGVNSTIRISSNNHQADNNSVTDIICAADAVCGALAASQELPYMTPPNVNNNGVLGPQVNFSGDSQDSSKGYTSITVRAPIKDIKDAYSDDSDEMYQTIPDANNQSIYTSGSETYAQIQPQITVAVEINNSHLQEQANLDYNNENNAANNDSTKQQHYGHSRQGSNSSSIQNLGSPKPEKRPANSPLPPPPSSVASSSNLDKPIQNVNDMYAKVNKKPKINDLYEDKSKNPCNKLPAAPPLDQVTDKKYVRKKIDHNYETIKTSPKKSQQQNSLDSDPGYERLQPRSSITEPGYESVSSNSTALEFMDPNYEQLRPKSPPTSTLQNNISTASSVVNSTNLTVDGYSVIRHDRQSNQSSVSSDILTNTTARNSLDEPNYESMPNSENSESVSVEKEQNLLNIVEYKRLHNASDEGDCKKKQNSKSTCSNIDLNLSNATSKDDSANSSQLDDLDPNYESLNKLENSANNDEPNYESVKYDTLSDESKLLLARKDGKQEVEGYDDGYEKIKKNFGKIDKRESENPDYETIGKVVNNSEKIVGENSRVNLRGGDDFFEV